MSSCNRNLLYLFLIVIPWLLFFQAHAEDNNCFFEVKGIVVDQSNFPLPGVTIRISQSNHGVVTDVQGSFKINNLTCGSHKLQFSYVGFQALTFEVEPFRDTEMLTIVLEPASYQLSEVEVVSKRGEERRRVESISINRVEVDFLAQNRSGSLMQTLRAIPGVNSMDIGTGVSKPMIRGLGYYRVVFAQNGIKQSGQLWSSHTGLSVDQHNVHHLEVIKGPASLRFGSDAIGGVINTLPADIPQQGVLKGEVSFRGQANTGWLGGSAHAGGRTGDFYFLTTLTHNSFGDFRVPYTDVFLLPRPSSAAEATHEVELGETVPNTAGRENAFSLLTGVVKPWGNSYLDFTYHHSHTGFFDWIGLQHEDRRASHMADIRDIKNPAQIVENFNVHSFTNVYMGENKLELALGYQYNLSSEHSILSDRTGNRAEDIQYFRDLDNLELKLDLHNITANGLYSFRQLENQTLDFIINAAFETNHTDGYSHILPGYEKLSGGLGIVYQYVLSPKWVINSGARVDMHNFHMEETLNPDPAFGDSVFNPDFQKTFVGTSFSAGVNYLPSEQTILKLHVGKSYRIPSAYELGAYGLHRHEGRFERGDIQIEPEQAWQLDAGLETRWHNLHLMVSPFVNYFTSYLYLNPTAILRPEGQVYEYRQTQALLYGGEISLDYTFRERLNLLAGMEYVYAMNLDLNNYLPFTPPMSAITGATLLLGENTRFAGNSIGVEGVWAAAQNHTVPNELRTPGYGLLNLSFQSHVNILGSEMRVRVEARNVLNQRYFNHISFYRRMRIPEPGRDFRLFVTIPF
ncbi:MAG: TonB-dependent receptor [Bacteroidetes bacterium]|nr:MAG: TonB-dependent receptor [Bacteroidota bacterium]